MNIDDFMEEMGILSYEDLESEDFTTLGGLAMFLIDVYKRQPMLNPVMARPFLSAIVL